MSSSLISIDLDAFRGAGRILSSWGSIVCEFDVSHVVCTQFDSPSRGRLRGSDDDDLVSGALSSDCGGPILLARLADSALPPWPASGRGGSPCAGRLVVGKPFSPRVSPGREGRGSLVGSADRVMRGGSMIRSPETFLVPDGGSRGASLFGVRSPLAGGPTLIREVARVLLRPGLRARWGSSSLNGRTS